MALNARGWGATLAEGTLQDLGFGRNVGSETELPDMFAITVWNG